MLVKGYQFKKISWTCIHAIRTSGTQVSVNLWQAIAVHMNGVKSTDDLAISQAKTPPGAAFAATGYHRCCATSFKTLVFRNLMSLIAATTTFKPGNKFLVVTDIDIKIFSDGVNFLGARYGALAWWD
jgi:hypothetical protein